MAKNSNRANDERLLNKFPYIVAWGKKLGSFRYYVVNECYKAEEQNAPEDAIYYSSTDKRWHTKSECREELQKELELYKEGKLGGILA